MKKSLLLHELGHIASAHHLLGDSIGNGYVALRAGSGARSVCDTRAFTDSQAGWSALFACAAGAAAMLLEAGARTDDPDAMTPMKVVALSMAYDWSDQRMSALLMGLNDEGHASDSDKLSIYKAALTHEQALEAVQMAYSFSAAVYSQSLPWIETAAQAITGDRDLLLAPSDFPSMHTGQMPTMRLGDGETWVRGYIPPFAQRLLEADQAAEVA